MGEVEDNAEAVAISALIVNDLKQKRTKDYKFSWEKALSHSGDTGVKLQYTHARLTSLLAATGTQSEGPNALSEGHKNLNPDTLSEDVALELVFLLGRWDEVLATSYHTLEPHGLVMFLFSLSNTTSRALTSLPVLNSNGDVARTRLALFTAAREVLGQGLRVLGIQPLERM